MGGCHIPYVSDPEPLSRVDATTHPLVSGNPAVNTRNMKAYVGIPLLVRGNQAVGTLCAIDSSPRHWTDHEVEVLNDLADILTAQLDDADSGAGRHFIH